jgi:uncharacterized membrane protein
MIKKYTPIATFSLLSLIGFLDATYLTLKYLNGSEVRCTILAGCKDVVTSIYATIGPVPVALLGALYSFFILMLLIKYFDGKNREILYFLRRFTVIGAIGAFGFILIQALLIGAYCIYCLVYDTSSIALFLIAFTYFRPHKLVD